MRIFSFIVAVLALLASLACLIMIPRYAAMYAEFGVALPVLTRFVLNFRWLLAGLLFLIALVLAVLGAAGKPKVVFTASILALVLLIVSSIVIPVALMLPLSTVIQSLDESGTQLEATPEAP